VGERIAKKPKLNTDWYDDLILLYQKTKGLGLSEVSSSLRNVGWECMKGFVHGKVHEHIRMKRLIHDRELCQKLFQESFFIFCKVIDLWNPDKNTKVLTWLGDCLPQELMNKVRLDQYHRSRDYKLEKKLRDQLVDEPLQFFSEEDQERKEVLEEVRNLLENMPWDTTLEREMANIMIYGKSGDWNKLQRSSNLGIGKFSKLRKKVIEYLRSYIMEHCSDKTREILRSIVTEK